MRTTHRGPRLARWCAALTVALLASVGGVWVRAQEEGRAQAPVPGGDSGEAEGGAPDRERVPSLEALSATLARLRQDGRAEVGGPAVEHASLALARARAAGDVVDAGQAGAEEEALRARRIAFAAITLAQAQRGRERARLARDEAALARHAAEGAERTAREALRVAQANALANAQASEATTQAPAAGPATAAPALAPTGSAAPAAQDPAP